MIKNKLTNEVFKDRQTAKQSMGHAAFNKAVKRGEIEYVVSTHNTSDVII